MKRGKFIVIEGPDGGGKSTQLSLLKPCVEQKGFQVLATREPGGTPLGEKVRELLLDNSAPRMSVEAELMLYMACRAQLSSEVIRPALESGKVVLSERFLLSSVVYQGYAGGIPPDRVKQIGRLIVGDLAPDLVLILDVPPDVGAARRERSPDRIEERGADYHARVRQGFLAEAGKDPDKLRVISAEAPVEEVHSRIVEVVCSVL